MDRKKCIAAILLAFILVMSSFVVPAAPNGSNPTVTVAKAAAKKDKKKPVIKFSGKTNITVEKNEVVKIPKTTAKDNKDGNVTKKITITVKKGKTSYKSIATKIKKNKKVKFSSTGKYVVTYTVKDKAGNKATKKRYITVVDPKTKTTETTQTPVTEVPTTENQTTQTTTEKVTTETPKEEKTPTDYSKYNIKQVEVDGITYNVTRDYDIYYVVTKSSNPDKISLTIENDYSQLFFDIDSGLADNAEYLKYLGKITAYDENGNNISDRVVIYEAALNDLYEGHGYILRIYVEDYNGNSLSIDFYIRLESILPGDLYGRDTDPSYVKLSDSPNVYGHLRQNN